MKLYKKLFSYMPERKIHGILAAMLAVVGNLLQFYAYYLIWILLRDVFCGEDLINLKIFSIKILVLFASCSIFYFGGTWMSHLAGFRLETRLREKGLRHLLRASNTFFDTHNSGEVRKIIDNNVEQTHMIVAHLITDQTMAALTPILMIALTFAIDIYLGIFFVIIILLSMYLLYKMIGDQSFMKKYMEKLDEMNAGAVEYVRGMPVVKIFNTPLIGFTKLYDSIMVYKDMDPNIWSAKILFFTLFMGLFFVDLMKIMYVSMYVFQANSAVDNLENLFTEMKEKEIVFGTQKDLQKKNIIFKNVDFSYDDKNKILHNFSLNLDENKVYALVGSSGSGKSTIAKLISGLYPVDSGEILIGDRNISSYDGESLMKNIGIVFQNPKLFQGISIFENVKLANKDADDEEVYKALKLARCDDFIDKFKDKYDAIIGAEGINLSGGEKQRISIARIFLKDPKIIILDEASAAADPENEYELQIAFKELIKDRTTIMIAHRLSSIRGVDEILLVEDGKILERGSHDELMKEDSRYKKFIEMYNEANEWRVDL